MTLKEIYCIKCCRYFEMLVFTRQYRIGCCNKANLIYRGSWDFKAFSSLCDIYILDRYILLVLFNLSFIYWQNISAFCAFATDALLFKLFFSACASSVETDPMCSTWHESCFCARQKIHYHWFVDTTINDTWRVNG